MDKYKLYPKVKSIINEAICRGRCASHIPIGDYLLIEWTDEFCNKIIAESEIDDLMIETRLLRSRYKLLWWLIMRSNYSKAVMKDIAGRIEGNGHEISDNLYEHHSKLSDVNNNPKNKTCSSCRFCQKCVEGESFECHFNTPIYYKDPGSLPTRVFPHVYCCDWCREWTPRKEGE